jgi:NhaA family Na+:H+ antiporter
MLRFLRSEAAGGVALIAAAVVALIWSNVLPSSYHLVIEEPLLAGVHASSIHYIVNDAFMVLFFLLVGLEIRREMMSGQLSSLQRMAAPALAALGGMVVPALFLVALNWGDGTALRGWAVPVATDIAFSLAVLRVLGGRVPAGLKVFLTALAIIDDIGAIVVIAIFYTHHLDIIMGVAALAVCVALVAANRLGVRTLWPYLVGGVVLWALVASSGVHATLAGVALAFLIPATPEAPHGESAAIRLEHALAGIVAWVVLPLFGLANAGLRLDTLPSSLLSDSLVLGVAGGLFLGKQVGVFGVTRLACALKIVRLPAGLTWTHIYGASLLCGIGFTMSLFIAELAFEGYPRHEEVKLAVFAGSLLSAVAALAVLWGAPAKVADSRVVTPPAA